MPRATNVLSKDIVDGISFQTSSNASNLILINRMMDIALEEDNAHIYSLTVKVLSP